MAATSASVTGFVRGVCAATGSTTAKRETRASERDGRKGDPFDDRAFLHHNGPSLPIPKTGQPKNKSEKCRALFSVD
jgi:hypothetical protein